MKTPLPFLIKTKIEQELVTYAFDIQLGKTVKVIIK